MHRCMVYDVTVDGSGENVDSFSGLMWFIKHLGVTRDVLLQLKSNYIILFLLYVRGCG